MKKHNYKELKTIREKKGITQVEMSKRLCMTQSTYSKLESGQRRNTSWEVFERLAKVLGLSLDELQSVLSEKNVSLISEIKEKHHNYPEELITLYQETLMGFIYSAHNTASSKYEESHSWEELDANEKEYVVDICEITTKEEYEELPYPLTSFISKENDQKAFEEMIDDMNIYMCFEFRLIQDDSFLKMWQEFKMKNEPKFIISHEDGYRHVVRKGFDL